MEAIIVLPLFILGFLGGLAGFTFFVHQIAKRMKPDTHKAWPIGIVFGVTCLIVVPTDMATQTEPTVISYLAEYGVLLPLFLSALVIWIRFDHWDLAAEKPVFGRDAAAKHAARKAATQQKPVQ